jgi:hypothetical protein
MCECSYDAVVMKGYVFLAIGAMWLLAAICLHRTGFGIVWLGNHDHALALRLFGVVFNVLFLGWIAPVSLGAWLLWKK